MTAGLSKNETGSLTPKALLEQQIPLLIDPLARELAQQVNWWRLPGMEAPWNELNFPVCRSGIGSPVLLLHGFDSSFLEFRRLVPLLSPHHQLVIPDLLGFGFCPRPRQQNYGPKNVIRHLEEIFNGLDSDHPIGVIGASMGGSVAIELARRFPSRINRLMLLAPAGLTGRPMPVPPILDQLGVWFLSLPNVRRGLCRQAFADPQSKVGAAEEQIASLHLQMPGWAEALRSFARSGGFAGCGPPPPQVALKVLWGTNDRILSGNLKKAAIDLLGSTVEELNNCGHLPHLDHPEVVAERWLDQSWLDHGEGC